MRYALLISLILCATAGNVWGQPKRKTPQAKPADALVGKRKRTPKAHDKYANQEVSYRQSKGKRAAVFEPNNEPLWAKQRRKQVRAKNQDIEVENDETHRTRSRATRTETVNNNETLRTKPQRKNIRRRKN